VTYDRCIDTIGSPDNEHMVAPNMWSIENKHTGLFISPSGIFELDCTSTKTDTAERTYQ